jgi:hypothetical protein
VNVPRNGELSRVYQVIGVALVGLLAGGGGSWVSDQVSPPRPDPFTGTMGRELRADMVRALEEQDRRLREVEGIAGKCQERVAALVREHDQIYDMVRRVAPKP